MRIQPVSDANSGHPLGLAPYTENWCDGTRQSAGAAYPLEGIEVMTYSEVVRILLEQSGGHLAAIGIELVNGRCLYAKEEVIISCGALRTPQVLMLFGIGPADELQRHGITTVLDSPDVGQGLHDHVMFPQYWRVRNPEKGVAAGSPAFSDPAFQKGFRVTGY